MAREVDFLGYLPQIFKEIEEIQVVAHVETPILNGLWQKIEEILKDQFIVTATDSGLSRQEKMLKLIVPATDTTETRRFRLLTRYQEQAPYTNKVLKQLLDSLLGEGKYFYERNVAEKWVKVKLELTVKGQFEVVELMLERITPQNMMLTVELRYNTWGKIKQFTWGQLKTKTWGQIKEEVL